ncbi:MAG: DUF6364 family protein [Mariprofundales bacterium]
MNITLSADAMLIEKGREYASAHHTSLNQLIRDYLSSIAGEGNAEESVDEFIHLAQTMGGQSDHDFTFSRSAIYDRDDAR